MNQTIQDLKKSLKHIQCPYLKVSNSSKTCIQINGELTEFDVKHFCENKPLLCYYYRTTIKKIETLDSDNKIP